MLLEEINRVVRISGGKKKKGFEEIPFDKMLSKPKAKKGFKAIDFKKMKKDAPVSEQ